MIKELISKYKRIRSEEYLERTYRAGYAFVGMGQHALSNLYPVLSYLGVPLRYICVTNSRKAKMIEEKFPGVKGVTSLDEILADEGVKGVFVAASPDAHFKIARKVLKSGKALFIEKPPCGTAAELEDLITYKGNARVGLQRRYCPAVDILRKRLKGEKALSYDLHYVTGAYPEGDPLVDLYIHPLDLVCFLFGKAEILSVRRVAGNDYVLMLDHGGVVGTLELSTGYSWEDARDSLSVRTDAGVYCLEQSEDLNFISRPSKLMGVPLEKLGASEPKEVSLAQRNTFSPVLAGNMVYSHGFYDELLSFVEDVEGRKSENLSDLASLRNTFALLEALRKA